MMCHRLGPAFLGAMGGIDVRWTMTDLLKVLPLAVVIVAVLR
jgi:hypothetical protein